MCEKDHKETFVGWKRSGCFVHTLQLDVKVLKRHQQIARVNSALAIVEKVNKSCRATERLIQLAGKKLVINWPTRGIRYF